LYIKFFKSAFPLQFITIGIIALLLWLRAFIEPLQMPSPDGPVPLYQMIFNIFHSIPVISTLLGFLLVVGESFWITAILNRNALILKNSSLTSLIFVVLMSMLPEQLTLTPVNITVFLMLLILQNLLISYNKPDHLDLVFAAGFFTAMAGLFYLPFLLWFTFVPISFVVFRSGQWREWVVSMIGMTTPFVFLSVYYFWFDQLTLQVIEYLSFFRYLLFYPNPFGEDFMILGGFTLILVIWGIFSIWSGPMEKTVEVRAKTNLFLWIILFTGLSFTFSRSLAIYHPLLAVPALSFVISGALTSLKKTKIAEWILLVYFLTVLLNNSFLHSFYSPS